MSTEYGPHELDFRFERRDKGEEFLFVHHGANLCELPEVIDLARLGSTFAMVDARQPFTLEQALSDPSGFQARYGVEPVPLHGRWLQFDTRRLADFFRGTRDDLELDCVILGLEGKGRSEAELEALIEGFQTGDEATPLPWEGSWLHTHDNHFFWLVSRSPDLLPKLIEGSIAGFFRHVCPHDYQPVPGVLIDRLIEEFSLVPLVCFPTEFVEGKEVPTGVEVEADSVRALLETASSWWTAYNVSLPSQLLGRGLLVSYDFRSETWSLEPWA